MILGIWLFLNIPYFFIWLIEGLDIDIEEDISEKMLRNKREFVISIYPIQYAILKEDTINNVGKTILITVLSIVGLPMTILVFITICLMLLIKIITYGFMKMFGTSKPQWNEWWR